MIKNHVTLGRTLLIADAPNWENVEAVPAVHTDILLIDSNYDGQFESNQTFVGAAWAAGNYNLASSWTAPCPN
jgi:hypothetical protein